MKVESSESMSWELSVEYKKFPLTVHVQVFAISIFRYTLLTNLTLSPPRPFTRGRGVMGISSFHPRRLRANVLVERRFC